ncbi:hypothetical protein Tco_1014134 [Tanacetum coccineum]
MQKNPFFHILVDILRNTNFFRDFSASASVPSIYIQQFWNTMTYEEKTGIYSCQLNEQMFTLSAVLLRKALEITPIDLAHPFESPSAGDTVMDFMNQLGYPELGIVTRKNVDHAELLWEEFVQGIQTFFSHKVSLKIPNKKPTPLLIPYGDDFLLGNLKFVPKGEKDEVFGMPIPKELITETMKQASYYQQYLEMVARNSKDKEGGKKKTTSEVKKTSKPVPKTQLQRNNQNRLVDEEEEIQKEPKPQGKSEDSDVECAINLSLDSSQARGEGEDYDYERAIKMSLDSFQSQSQAPIEGVAIREPIAEEIQKLPEVEGKGNAISTDEQAAHSLLDLHQSKKKSATDHFILQRRIPVTYDTTTEPFSQPQDDTSEKVVQETSSPSDSTSVTKVGKEQGEEASTIVAFEEKIADRAEDQAGPDPGKGHEALAGSNPEPMNEDFYVAVYPKVHENLKLRTDEHVILENPTSLSGTLSSMKNLDDTDNFGDHFLNDNPIEEVHANISAPPLSIPVVDLTTSTPPPLQVHAPLITATTKTIAKILALPPPLPTQSSTDSELAA